MRRIRCCWRKARSEGIVWIGVVVIVMDDCQGMKNRCLSDLLEFIHHCR